MNTRDIQFVLDSLSIEEREILDQLLESDPIEWI